MSNRRFRSRLLLIPLLVIAPLACSDSPTGTDDDDDGGASLNFFEQELVGLWSRWHSYDGSSHYIRFNADRTACKWEEPSGSESRISQSSYSSWSIDDTQPSDRMAVSVSGAGITWMFDYPDDELWPDGYRTNLARSRSSEGKTCS